MNHKNPCEVVKTVRVHNKNCLGVRKYGGDIMVTMFKDTAEDPMFWDFFIANDQAEAMIEDLKMALADNKEMS